jgi:hypothetical protein
MYFKGVRVSDYTVFAAFHAGFRDKIFAIIFKLTVIWYDNIVKI